jgi:hypothetical protein
MGYTIRHKLLRLPWRVDLRGRRRRLFALSATGSQDAPDYTHLGDKPSSNASWAVSRFVQRARDVVADVAERLGPDVGDGLVGHGAAALDSVPGPYRSLIASFCCNV